MNTKTPIEESPCSKKKECKKNLIMDAAFDLFLKNGYLSTKIIDIALRAGIGKGTIYEYFKSKEEILLALMTERVLFEYKSLANKVNTHTKVTERLKEFLDFQVGFVGKYGAYAGEIKQQFMDSGTEISKEIYNAIMQILSVEYETVFKIVSDGINSGELKKVDPALITHFIIGVTTYYASIGTGVIHGLDLPGILGIDSVQSCTEEDLFSLIFNGITK